MVHPFFSPFHITFQLVLEVQQACLICTRTRATEAQQQLQQQQQDNGNDEEEEEDGDTHDYVNSGKSRAVHVVDEYIDVSGMVYCSLYIKRNFHGTSWLELEIWQARYTISNVLFLM